MQKERNVYVSVIKLISTSFVVFIHAPFPGNFGRVMDCMSRFAVPLMFIISGYYSYHAAIRTIKKRLRKIFLLTLFSNLLYFVWNCYDKKMIHHESVRDYIHGVFNFETLSHFLFTGDNPLSAHLWYLTTLILIYVVFLMITKFWKRVEDVSYKPVYILAACSFMFQIAEGIKAQSVGIDIHYLMYRYFLFFGFPFFSFGLFLHEYGKRINERYNITLVHVLLMILIGIALSLLQCFEIGKVEVPLGMLPVVLALAIVAFVKPNPRISRNIVFAGMEIVSTVIFIIHPLVRNIIVAYKDSTNVFYRIKSAEYFYPLYVLGFSVIIGVVIAIVVSLFRRCSSEV